VESKIELEMLPQPDDTTCGPTCLHAVYRHYGDNVPIRTLIDEVEQLDQGGTLAVLLGQHALARGYDTLLYTFNVDVFDPTWFHLDRDDIQGKLRAQLTVKSSPRLLRATEAYLRYLEHGGEIALADLTRALVRSYLKQGVPILTGLSATYLYRSMRELGRPLRPDDLHGEPQGHFVVLCGYSADDRRVLVADPLLPNPMSTSHFYLVGIDRLVCAIMLGILTYDANILIVQPRQPRQPRQPGKDKP
jgi:hypothetical protein